MESGESGDVRKLVEEIAKALVDSPQEVNVQLAERDATTVVELRVAPGDMGRVIGRQGRTARSIRTVLGAAAAKLHQHFALEILE